MPISKWVEFFFSVIFSCTLRLCSKKKKLILFSHGKRSSFDALRTASHFDDE